MPSPLSTAVLRALSFLHPKKDPSLFLHRSLRRPTDAALSRISSPNPPMSFATYRRRSERNEAAISASENRPARIHSDRASFEGKREGREREMDALHDREEKEVCDSRLLTLPTMLTLGRVVSVPLLVSSYHMNGSWATSTTTGIFLVAAVTDWLDGYLARKMQLGSTFGAFLDPVADKLMVAATLILLCTKPLEVAFFGVVPWILTVPAIAIIGREITMSAVREWAASQNSRVLEAVAVNNLGKWKTATQMTALTILLLTRDPSLTGPGFLVSTGVFLLYVSAGLALWSLAVYMRKIWRFMIK